MYFKVVLSDDISPLDILDEAEKQLETLRSTVQGQIMVARNNMYQYQMDFSGHSFTKSKQALEDIVDEHITISDRIKVLQELADSAGVDVDHCIVPNKALIDDTPGPFAQALDDCIELVKKDVDKEIKGRTYTVDIIWNKVSQREFQLKQCNGQLLCISNLVAEIDTDMIKLPQEIQVEIENTEKTLELLQLSVDQCCQSYVPSFIANVTTVSTRMEDCVNDMLTQ